MAVLTIKHFNDSVEDFVSDISNEAMYVFVGHPEPWADDSNPPIANQSVSEYDQATYHEMCFGKRLTSTDVSYMLPNYTWANNTLYSQYDQDDSNIYNEAFFVVTQTGDVYKCLDNNGGANSIVQPNLILASSAFKTADGYTWKYMYTVSVNANNAFTSNSFIPIVANTTVSSNSVPGTIDVIRMTAGGNNYQTYASGYLAALINQQTVQLPSTCSSFSNFYTGSALYLKAGYGSGQLRSIIAYNGATKQAVVSPNLNTYAHLELTSVSGSITTGLLASQSFQYVDYTNQAGFLNINDTVIQVDTGIVGTIVTSNSTVLQIVPKAGGFSLNYPIYDTVQSSVAQAGKVNIIAGNTQVLANTGSSFVANYAVGNYIQVGDNANTNVRLILSVNSTVINCATAFSNTLAVANNYIVKNAVVPASITVLQANGNVSDVDLTGVILSISSLQTLSLNYTIGENVNMVNVSNVNQLANGIVSYANSSTVILEGVNGTFTAGLYILGVSSLQKATISYVSMDPSVTVLDPVGQFIAGQEVFFLNPANTLIQVANATLSSLYYAPNEATEFIVSPAVNITGDGSNALAYSVINSVTNSVSSIAVINPGINFSEANVTITANSTYGSGAVAYPVVSPVHGHGFDPIEELGSRWVGISKAFESTQNESYKFPGYGSYRIHGILKNPLFNDVTINLDTLDHSKLTIRNLVDGFTTGEIVIQPQSNAAGIVVYSNSSFLELQHVRGTFINNVSNDNVYGLTSSSTANTVTANVSYFRVLSTDQVVSETLIGANAVTTQIVSNTQIHLTNVAAIMVSNTVLVDASTNSYGNVASILTANGTTDVSTVFGLRFNQMLRLPLLSTAGSFAQFEYVTQAITNSSGRIADLTHELDIGYNTLVGGTFSIGNQIHSVGGNGTITFANSTYLRLTNVQGTLGPSINIGSVSANVANVYPVLLLYDVSGLPFEPTYNVVGNTSGAIGTPSNIANTTFFPDLVRDTGSVTLLGYVSPVTLSNSSVEEFQWIIQF